MIPYSEIQKEVEELGFATRKTPQEPAAWAKVAELMGLEKIGGDVVRRWAFATAFPVIGDAYKLYERTGNGEAVDNLRDYFLRQEAFELDGVTYTVKPGSLYFVFCISDGRWRKMKELKKAEAKAASATFNPTAAKAAIANGGLAADAGVITRGAIIRTKGWLERMGDNLAIQASAFTEACKTGKTGVIRAVNDLKNEDDQI